MSQKTVSSYLLVLCTCPDRETALGLARRLVDDRVAACVNVVDGLTSVYRGKEGLEEDPEALMLIKTDARRYRDLEEAIVRDHPYELPEVIAVRIERGLEEYLAWITGSTDASGGQ
ncbi:MAG: divalent-cation tolerance protein CutA [Gammaproteobacteria bacterium]|nr:MAG: divalent-cation tolerance protein CutA [Gammaproteobacteria bacterium]